MPRMPPATDLDILPLTQARFADLEDLFATGDPRWCWYLCRRLLIEPT
jgi:hypothetical protein